MIRMQEGKPGEGMSCSAFFQALTGMSLSNYIEREIEFWFNSLPCRLTPVQAQTVLNAVLEKKNLTTTQRYVHRLESVRKAIEVF